MGEARVAVDPSVTREPAAGAAKDLGVARVVAEEPLIDDADLGSSEDAVSSQWAPSIQTAVAASGPERRFQLREGRRKNGRTKWTTTRRIATPSQPRVVRVTNQRTSSGRSAIQRSRYSVKAM